MTNSRMAALTAAGVSAWLDDLSRDRIQSGNLAHLIEDMSVRGVTTNPTIFQHAISGGAQSYAEQLQSLAAGGSDVDGIIRALTTDDVRAACDLMTPVWQESHGEDGRVSIEVDPRLAHETTATIEQAKELWAIVDRPNALIKIPATLEGLPAITEVIGSGISVNVTLIFSVERYRSVVAAYEAGIDLALSRGHDVSGIRSVASFFVSRIDTEVDNRLTAIGTPEAAALLGTAALATARQVWQAHLELTSGSGWAARADQGAHVQRPLWASTGVKNPAYDPTRYVVELVAPGCVNTMPEATLDAVATQGEILGDTLDGTGASADSAWAQLGDVGIDAADVFAVLEREGVEKFIASWEELRQTVAEAAGLTA
jgi:transaldolase